MSAVRVTRLCVLLAASTIVAQVLFRVSHLSGYIVSTN